MTVFHQPSGQFTVYDSTTPAVEPDLSTPLLQAVVALESQIRNNKTGETGAFFDETGVVVVQRQGLPDQVSFQDVPTFMLVGRLFTHNHPGGAGFSLRDVRSAASLQLIELRVVTPIMRYRLAPQPGVLWPSPDQITAVFTHESAIATSRAFRMNTRGELNLAYTDFEIRHLSWKAVAKRFNLTYIQEKS